MNQPLVSVIILTYNYFNYLEQAIDSVLSQDYPKIEIVISDDGSEYFDNTSIDMYLKENSKPNIIAYTVTQNPENLGIVKNLNRSIKRSRGTYIVPLDCDDCFYDEKVITTLVKEFQKTRANVITGYMEVYDSSFKKFMNRSPEKSKIKLFKNTNRLFQELCRRNFIASACTSYSRKLFEVYGFLDERYTFLDDYPLYLKLTRIGERIHFFNRTIIKYRLGGISTRKAKNPVFEADINRILKQEILPYKEKISKLLYREKMFDYRRRTENKRHLFQLCLRYLDVVVVKIIFRVRVFFSYFIVSIVQIFRR
ncbi:glycosyltransferase [Sporolactobacillus laevolacticus]|uniref:glycosyltransferase n=1 Tax=Sporolactobacillus laevolacticus TaxID=33018 RepID=UPI0025B45CCE|nr:glycosyltransferase [Sporolactobacillus laevolacticus]MDN3954874.1 glycosyltransferase [Sporolactobacillus laevolacticus]